MKNKKIIIAIIITTIILGIFIITLTKNIKIGNANISQEIDIFNISSYEATIEMTVYSNKNENKYTIKQNCEIGVKSSQEILEPSNMKGIKIIQEENIELKTVN